MYFIISEVYIQVVHVKKTCYKTVFSNINIGLYFIVKRLCINRLIAIFAYNNLKITTMSEHLTIIKFVDFFVWIRAFLYCRLARPLVKISRRF